ncbi:DNA polymerase [Williamsia sp. Leaf354]|nr:DNA polymerase [Williamsia sp. Leaf354]
MRAVVERFRATSPRIVGSIARGEDHPGSDVDVLVDFTDEATLLDEVGMRLALTELLRVRVDVIASDSLHGEIRDRLLSEAVAV